MKDVEIVSGELAQRQWSLLCVDDDAEILSALYRLLRGSGYRVLLARSAADGLLALSRESIDIVISDMRMPEMDGIQFLERVRAGWPETVRILLTGHVDIAVTIAAINKGEIYRFVAKPWDNDELLRLIRQAIERQQMKAEKERLEELTRRQNEELLELNSRLEAKVRESTAELQKALCTITSAKDSQERADYLAHHDPLTGLPNRLLLADRMEHALNRARRRQKIVAVLFIDLDNFKHVNDRLGHSIGDALLQEVARAMRDTLRQEDTLARFGGDEFVALIEDVDTEEDAIFFAERLLEVFPRHVCGEGAEFDVSTSIGMSFYPRDGDNASQLIDCADRAMYQAKASGRADFCLSRNIPKARSGDR